MCKIFLKFLLAKGGKNMLDNHLRFKANDELALLNTISQTEITAKKAELYSGLATDPAVRKFFQVRATRMKLAADILRKHLDRIGGH
jgi:hypothetical protein